MKNADKGILSKSEWGVLLGASAMYWIWDSVIDFILGREWGRIDSYVELAVSLGKVGLVIGIPLLIAVFQRQLAFRNQWDQNRIGYRVIRSCLLFSSFFITFTAIAVLSFYRGRIRVSHDPTIPLVIIVITIGIMILIRTIPHRRKFFLTVTMSIVLISGALQMLPLRHSLDKTWYSLLDATKPLQRPVDTSVVIITMEDWYGAKAYSEMATVIARSNPKAIGVLFPLYRHTLDIKDTSLYNILPSEKTIYGTQLTSWGGDAIVQERKSNAAEDFTVHSLIAQRSHRGAMTGVTPLGWFSESFDWSYHYAPILATSSEISFHETEIDAAIALVMKYEDEKPPLIVHRKPSLWSSSTLQIGKHRIPLTRDGTVLINFPTRESYYSLSRTFYPRETPARRDIFRSIHLVTAQGSIDTVHCLDFSYVIRGVNIYKIKSFNYAGGNYELDTTSRALSLPYLEGKIVLITRAQEFQGVFGTDLMGYTNEAIIRNLLSDDYIIPLNDGWLLIVLGIMSVCILGAFISMRPLRALAMTIGTTLCAVALCMVLFSTVQVYIGIVPILVPWIIGVCLIYPVEQLRERERLLKEQTFLSAELRAAHDMQMGLMPKENPIIAGYEIASVCIPAHEVGGDFYDFVWLDEKKTKLGIAVADVSGKAMKAAMTAVLTSGMLYSEVQKSASPREVLQRINNPLYLRSDRRIFTALSFAVLELNKKFMTYSCAGQTSPVLIRAGKTQEIKVQGNRLPLGLREDLQYRELKLILMTGDVLVFTTDGIVESMNGAKELYGYERFEEVLLRYQHESANGLIENILKDIKKFTGSAPQHDDMTVVVVRVL